MEAYYRPSLRVVHEHVAYYRPSLRVVHEHVADCTLMTDYFSKH